jgi:hypothetical protein
MRLIVFIFYSAFAILNVKAQVTYSKMYDLFNSWESAINIYSLNQESKEILVWGDFTDQFNPNRADSMAYNGLYFAKIDSNLKLHLHNTILKFGFYVYAFSYLQINTNTESKFLIFGTKDTLRLSDPNKIYDYYIINLNIPDTSPFHNKINTITSKQAISSTFYLNNKIYLFGKTQHLSTAPFAILCIDTTGKQLWYKTYPGRRYQTSGVTIDNEGNFLLAGGGYKGDGGAFDTLFGWYAKMDTAGNFIWEKFHQLDDELLSGTPHLVNGSYFWLGGRTQFDKTTYTYLFKTDKNGNVTYQKRILEGLVNFNGYMDCDLSNAVYRNGYFYGMGSYTDSNSFERYRNFIQFGKYDTLGNLKWVRKFSQWYKDNRAFSLTAVSDGFIICADGKDTTHTTGFTDAWIIKTDTNGCIIPGCHLTDGLVQLTNPDAFVTVYPNPSTDKITVQITDNRAHLKSYLLYDSKGNFIKQQVLSNHPETVEITTTQYSNGYYYLVLELQGGERAVKKIMIQR